MEWGDGFSYVKMVVSWQETGMDVSWRLHRASIHEFFQTVP